MATLDEIYPHYEIYTVSCTIQFIWSDEMLTPEDTKLERLKFAILFTIAGMIWVKKAR